MKSLLVFLATLIVVAHGQLMEFPTTGSDQPIRPSKDDLFVAVYQRPRSHYDCLNRQPGHYYADLSTKCVVYHVCLPSGPNGRLESHGFACPKGKIFDEVSRSCQPSESTLCGLKSRPIPLVAPVLSNRPDVVPSVGQVDPNSPAATVAGSPNTPPKSKNYLAYLDSLQEMLGRIKFNPIRSIKLNELPGVLTSSIGEQQHQRQPANVAQWLRQVSANQPNQFQAAGPHHQFVGHDQEDSAKAQYESLIQSQPTSDPSSSIDATGHGSAAPDVQYLPQGAHYASPIQLRPSTEQLYGQPAQTVEPGVTPAPPTVNGQEDDVDPAYAELPQSQPQMPQTGPVSGGLPMSHMGYMDGPSDPIFAANDQHRPSTLLQYPAHDTTKYYMIKLRKKITKTTVNDGMPPALDPPGSYEQLRPHVTMPEMDEAMPYAGAQNLYETSGQNATATQPGQDDHVFMLSHYSALNEDGSPATGHAGQANPTNDASGQSLPESSAVEYNEPEPTNQPQASEYRQQLAVTKPSDPVPLFGPMISKGWIPAGYQLVNETALPAGADQQPPTTVDNIESSPSVAPESIDSSSSNLDINAMPFGAFQLIEKFNTGFRVAAVFDRDMRPLFTSSDPLADQSTTEASADLTTTPATVESEARADPEEPIAAASSISEIQEPFESSKVDSSNLDDMSKQYILPIPDQSGKSPRAYIILTKKPNNDQSESS